MSKSTYFTGQPVYSQVIKLPDKAKIQQISYETLGSERYVKRLTGWKHLIIMLFGVLKHFDSLRELEIGMKAETMKLSHLGLDYVVRRSTLAEANLRRSQEFFAKVYAYLLERYTPFLADSRSTGHKKSWEKQLYMMDSTTITLFDNILKGVGRHPKHGKKRRNEGTHRNEVPSGRAYGGRTDLRGQTRPLSAQKGAYWSNVLLKWDSNSFNGQMCS